MTTEKIKRIEVRYLESCPHCLQIHYREILAFCVICDDPVCAYCVRLEESAFTCPVCLTNGDRL